MDTAGAPSRHTFVILGAGPAGLQLGYYLEQRGCDYVILERSDRVGAFFRAMPRARELISFNKTHSLFVDPEIQLRWDWNALLTDDYSAPFRDFSRRLYPLADELLAYLEAFAHNHALKIRFNTRAVAVRRAAGGGFVIETADGGRLACDALIVATGLSKPHIPEIPGIELVDRYDEVSLDPEAYTGQRVLVIGKGNSALEVVDVALERSALVHAVSPRPLRLAYNSRHPGHVRALRSRLLDAYHLKTLNSLLDAHIERIERRPDGAYVVTLRYTHADGERDELVYDRVVCCTGFRFDASLFAADCAPATVLDGRLPGITPYWESTNVPGLHFAGTLMQARDFKRSSSAFIDGFRYNIRTLAHVLLERHAGVPRPTRRIAGGPDALARALLERASRTSALWAQFGYLCDVFVVRGAEVVHHEELPYQAIREGELADESHYYTLTFEWGAWEGDVMAIDRHPSAAEAHRSVFLHPIVRRYAGGQLAAEHHLLEDLFGVYSAERERGAVLSHSGRPIDAYHVETHEAPLRRFLADDWARAATESV